ncbi:MAG: cyclic nucleotide-binding domain-containing protein [Deltaproteobacteria bacterium]|nr:cyclic nucleotide-binding domain-containing protein [Deltaproteobacteria bacterium]
MDYREVLAKVSLFSQMNASDLKRIAALVRARVYQEGDIIIQEGSVDRRLFIITHGNVEVVKNLGSKKEIPVGSFGPLSYFGEMALIDDEVRSASVVAKEKTQVLTLDHLELLDEIKRYPDMAVELLQMLSRRIRLIEKTLINTLGSFLPVCANCRKIRDKDGVWTSMEKYISDHSDTEFSHGICPHCAAILYPNAKSIND